MLQEMNVVQVNILENSNWVQTYGDKYKTSDGMSPPTMFIFLPNVLTTYDTSYELDFHAFLVINSVDINLVIQPAVFGDRQND